jgi:hypothetical protein
MSLIVAGIGRMVQGSCHTASTVGFGNQELVWASGPKKGEPRGQYFFAVAYLKTTADWRNEPLWGVGIFKEAKRSFPDHYTKRSFAFKVIDGDSTEQNDTGKKVCNRVGFAGHWVVKFSSNFAPAFSSRLHKKIDAKDIKCGDFLEVQFSVVGNGYPPKPGVFINPRMVQLAATGNEIVAEEDPTAVFSGNDALHLPEGASALVPLPEGASALVPKDSRIQLEAFQDSDA